MTTRARLSAGVGRVAVMLTIAAVASTAVAAEGFPRSLGNAVPIDRLLPPEPPPVPGETRIRELVRTIPLTVRPEIEPRRFERGFQGSGTPNRRGVPWGIAIGVVAGLALSGGAAARYGENEGGSFCGPCFVQWSAVTVPAGAALGALVGYLVSR